MAGVQAGRLSIEIVAEIARLQQDLDKAKRAVKAASGDIAKSTKVANDNLAGMAGGMGKIAPSSRMAAFGMRNLAFQAQDLGVQLAMASQSSDPLRMSMMALAMQGPQIRDAFKQTGQSVTGLVTGFVRAHPVLLAITTALGVAAGGFKLFSNEITKSGELDRFAQSLGLTKDEMEKLGPASVTVGDAIRGVWRTIDEGLGLSAIFSAIADWSLEAFRTVLRWGQNAAAGIYAGFVGTFNGIKAVWPMLPEVIGDAAVQAANAAIAAIEGMVNKSIVGLNALVQGANMILGTDFAGLDMVDFGQIENRFAGAGRDAAGAFASAYRDAYSDAQAEFDSLGQTLSDNIVQASKDRLAASAQEIIDDRTEKKVGDRSKKVGKTAAEKLFEQLVKDAQGYISNLEEEIARFGKSSLDIHRMEVAMKAAAAPTKELADRIRELGGQLEALMIGEANAEMEKRLQALRDELSLLGLVGSQRELAALALEKEAFFAEELAKGTSDVNAKWEEYLRLRTAIISGESALKAEADRLRLYNDALRDTMYMLEHIGGLGSVLSGLLGFAAGNIGGIRGPLGALLNTQTGQRRDKETGEIIAVRLGDELREIFGLNGTFGRTLSAALNSAGIGMAAGNMVGAKSTGGQIGSAAGGVLGGIAGNLFSGAIGKAAGGLFGKALGSAIGSAVPVVGTILGGILGGLAGDLIGSLGGTKRGSAIFGAGGVTGHYGNSSGRKDAAGQLADQAVQALAEIAESFGAQLNTAAGKVSIGIREGNLFVDPQGRGYTKQSEFRDIMGFGTDQGAAVAAAVLDLIKDGAITGLREGTKRLLAAGGDLQQQMQKAMAFEGVFKALEEAADPAAAALKQLQSEFDALRRIFDEAGASAAERATLEELYERRKAELATKGAQTDETASKRRELEIALMTSQGRYMEALAAARADELAQLEPSLRALQDQLWAAELVNERRLLEIQLMEAQGNAAGALAARRELELAATHESLRALKEQLWAAEDAREAVRAAEQLRDAWASVSDGIMEEVRRIRGLAGGGEGESFAKLIGQFNAMTAAARAGDLDAARNLPGLSQAMLRAAEMAATSRQELDRVRAQAAASLEATHAAVQAMTGNDQALATAAQAMASTSAANDGATGLLADSNRALRDELAALRSEMKAGLAAVAGNTGRVAKKLDDVTAASGGDAISTQAAA